MRLRVSPIPILFVVLASAAAVCSQDRCFTPDEAAKAVASVASPSTPADIQNIRKELVNMRVEHEKLSTAILGNFSEAKARVPELNALSRSHLVRVCEILRGKGWLDPAGLRQDGFDALLFLITSTKAVELQRELFPVLVAATKKGDVPKHTIAELTDGIRLGYGQPQIFGTQATRRGDIIYILPLLNDTRVDEWRKAYELPPLADEIRLLERQNLLPVLKSQRLSAHSGVKTANADIKALGISDTDEAIKVDTKAVNLNVIVSPQKGQPPPASLLTKEDFAVFEDGVQQDVTFFTTADTPFDLVLVLDFSGSTADKRSLIKKAAKRFVEVARPNDRIAIVAFATDIDLVSDLASDKDSLYKAIDKINLDGDSPVWDSLKFAYEDVLKKDSGRRTAIVFMTDGEDNASKITFADAMEVVRHGDTTIFPIYVNTLESKESQTDFLGRLGAKLHTSLTMLADETGGRSYKADSLKDLNGIYEQVINDIGKIYTLGYEPKNETHDGGWRAVEVKLTHSPTLTAKTRRGYYAN